MFGGALRRGGNRQERCPGKHEKRSTENGEPAEFASVAQFVEEKIAPEDAEKAVDVPKGKSDAEADVANGENGERVGNGPEAAGEDSPDDQVRGLANVGAHLARAADESRKTPAGEEDADYHQERNDEGRNA